MGSLKDQNSDFSIIVSIPSKTGVFLPDRSRDIRHQPATGRN
jgi:hypothetical protein